MDGSPRATDDNHPSQYGVVVEVFSEVMPAWQRPDCFRKNSRKVRKNSNRPAVLSRPDWRQPRISAENGISTADH